MGDHHDHEDVSAEGTFLEPEVLDRELSMPDLTRRKFLRAMGLIGAATGASRVIGLGGGAPAASALTIGGLPVTINTERFLWLAGDHHTHTQYSSDGQYTVSQQVAHASQYGLQWMVITDHGRVAHEKVGIDKTRPGILQARADFPAMLVYQGLEWNIPGAEHGTVFMAPSDAEVALLHEFERMFDGVVVFGAAASAPSSEPLALDGIRYLAAQVRAGRTSSALFLANHPSRRGLDAPHEIRNWIDADSTVAVGMEGAPGHQAAGIAASAMGPGSARGFYDNAPTANSHPGYPPESYRTFGGFDWMTAKVGGLWDSLLSEGRRWWITANSDAHSVYKDTFVRGPGNGEYDNPASPYFGGYGDPVDTGVPQGGRGDFWPGYYSRTHVGSTAPEYAAVMEGIRKGRMWVGHGDLIRSLDVRVLAPPTTLGLGATLGDNAVAPAGGEVILIVRIDLAIGPNANGDLPQLRRVDLITGAVTGPGADRDSISAPVTQVVKSFDVSRNRYVAAFQYRFTNVRQSFFLRLRGTDGNFSAPGSIEPRLDPVPIDPWTDLWFYSNPIFVDVR